VSRRFIAPCVACSLLLLTIAGAVGYAQQRQEIEQELESLHERLDEMQSRLERTREEREQTRSELQEAQQKETSLLSLVERYSSNIQSGRANLERWRELEREAEEKLQEINQELSETRRKLSRRRTLLKKRLRAMYKQGELSRIELLSGADSMTDFLTRTRYFRTIVKKDRSVIENFRESRQRLLELKEQRKQVLAERRRIRKREESWLEHLEDLKQEREQLLAEIRNRQDFYERRLQELEQQQEKARSLVGELQRERQEKQSILQQISSEFGRQQGNLPWPVESRDICRPFGKWEERGLVHENDGIDVCVNEGARVRAVSAGTVLVAREFRGMGHIVIIGHGDRYTTLYGSLVKPLVETGQEVKQGGVIGQAGQTAGMDRPRLYFQIFENKTVKDPTEWLR
jgi:septal ring factor EnvC (AmiA/AmiB activator)